MQKLLVISCQSSEIIKPRNCFSTTQRPWIGINSDVPKFDLTHWISIDNKSLINEFILIYTHYQLWQFQYWENWFLFWKWVRQKLLNHEYLPLWWWFQADFRLNLQKYAALCPWFSCFHQFLSLILTVLNVRFDCQWPLRMGIFSFHS